MTPLEAIHALALEQAAQSEHEIIVHLSYRYGGLLRDFARRHPDAAPGHGASHATIGGVRYVVQARIGEPPDDWEAIGGVLLSELFPAVVGDASADDADDAPTAEKPAEAADVAPIEEIRRQWEIEKARADDRARAEHAYWAHMHALDARRAAGRAS